MAQRPVTEVVNTPGGNAPKSRYVQHPVTEVRSGTNPSLGATVYCYMRGRDPDCVTQPTYRYWVVTGVADYTAAQYAGPLCGAGPLVEVSCLRRR